MATSSETNLKTKALENFEWMIELRACSELPTCSSYAFETLHDLN